MKTILGKSTVSNHPRWFGSLKILALLFTVGLGGWSSNSAWAVPADPTPREMTQPDGTKIQVRLRGDEFFHWTETTNGYAVVKDTDQFWKYAQPATNQAEFRAIKSAQVGASDPVRLGLRKHDLPDVKVLRKHVLERRKALNVEPTNQATAQTSAQAAVQTAVPAAGASSSTVHPNIAVSGTKTIKNIVILACFSNHWDAVNNTVLPAYGRVDTSEYNNLYNQVGYNADGAVGSVRDFYTEVSYGKLTIDSTITIWVRLPRESSYYGQGTHGGLPSIMVADAIAAAAAAGFDFSQGDSDGDGWVDVLDVLHSGYGEESTGNPDDVWSVKGSMSSVVTQNGVKMYNYHEEPALRGASGTGIERIGTICHESGHFFGLPDLYDYSSLTSGLGNWCLMSGASWNGTSGTSPGHPSAWAKVFLGFARTMPVHSKTGFSLPRVEDNSVVGMLRDGTTNEEYFLIENRAKVGFDNSPQMNAGLLIYHVDQKNANNDLGTWPHPAVKIEEADGNDSLGVAGGGTEVGDAWTSTSGLAGGWTDQTGNTNTTAMLYQSGSLYSRTDNTAFYSYNSINHFSAASSTMTFNVQSLKTDAPNQTALPAAFNVVWAPSSQAAKYEIQEGSPVTLTSFTDGAESEDAMYDNWYVAGKTQSVVTNASHGGAACYVLGTQDYGAIQSLTLRNPFTVTASTVISFYLLSHVSSSGGFLKCEISNDNGNTWKNLGTYNNRIDPWSQCSFNFAAINAAGINSGDVCLVRFAVDIEYTYGWSGFPAWSFALDDISITGTQIASYGNWTSLNNNLTTNACTITGKAAGTYAYRVQAYAKGAWQGFGAVGETAVRANQAPVWTANPIAGAEANAGAAYNADLSALATDEVNDVVTFSKVSGPAWLTVNADGTIAGTSQSSDAGLNTFTIRATDLAGAYADTTLTINVNSPIADWHMNELAGPTIYDSIGGFNGTAQGSLVYGQSGVPGAAAGNSAISFSGSGTAVSTPALNVASNTFTITAMVKRNGTQGYLAGIVSSPEFTFGFGSSDNRLTYVRSYIYNSSTLVVPDNQWTFVALAVSPDGAVLYMATNSAVSAYSTGRTDPASTVFAGAGSLGKSGWSNFNGAMDDVTIYNQALTASQISQLAATAFTPVPQVIVSSPTDGTGFTKPATFDLGASIVTNGHSVTKVQFYNGSTMIGEDATAPYSVTETGLVNGTYAFSAKAVYDGGNVISSVPVTIHVTNAPPVCVADSASTSQNTSVTIPVLANDTDPYGLTLALQSVTQPARGTAVISGTNVIYTPNSYTYGLDTFTYTAFDGVDSTAVGTATVTTPFPNFASTFTNAVLAAGPVAYWRLNEASGTTVYDSTVNAKNGTKGSTTVLGANGVGAPTFPGFESGNTAYQFDGTSGTRISVPALNLNSGGLTITAWVKRNGAQSYTGIVSWKNSDSTTIIDLGFGNSDGRLTYIRNGSVYNSTSLIVPDNQWTFVALTLTSGNAVLYMATNSTLASYTITRADTAITVFTNSAYIGYAPYGSAYFNGSIDEVAVFNQTLTPSQISGLLAAAQTGLPAITLTAPANGGTFNGATGINLAAAVTTNGNHTVEKVQFYTNATLLAEATAPYQFTWSSAPSGSYAITAKLLYDGGSVLTSAAANITVTNAVAALVTNIWSPGSNLVVNVSNAAGAAGAGYTQTNYTGFLDVSATAANPFIIQLGSLNGGSAGLAANFNNDSTYVWTIATTTREVLEFDPAKIVVDTSAFSNDLAGGTFSVTTNGSAINLVFTPNHAPVAFPLSFNRASGTTLRIPLSYVLTNFTSDPDGDLTAMTGLGASTNGTPITTNAVYVFFTPTNSVSESFTYTIHDVRNYRPGDTVRTATNWINITVTNAVSSALSVASSGGRIDIHFAGVPGYAYDVECSTNLSAWTVVWTTNVPAHGLWIFTDPNPPQPSAFYRLRQH
jgi:M6 family metalloprotease-like protein